MAERCSGLESSSAETCVARKAAAPKTLVASGLLLGLLLSLVVLHPTQAEAARCTYPTQFYRASLGVCEAKAGNPLYRGRSTARTASKAVKSARVLERARSRPGADPMVRQVPAAEPEIGDNANAIPAARAAPLNVEDEVAEFEARWWPVREVEQRQLRTTDGVRSREGQSPVKAVQ
jgi:hypothetical protein